MDPTEFAKMIEWPFSMCIASKRNTGKSVLVEQLQQALKDADKVDQTVVFSATVEFNHDYSTIPDRLKRGWDEEALARLIDHQKKKPEAKRKRILVILDDLLGEDGAQRSPSISFLYSKGRHINFSVILSSQQANLLLTPINRNNSDWILASRLSQSQSEMIWEVVSGIRKRDFVDMLNKLSKDYHFVTIDRTSNSTELVDYIHVVKSNPPEKKSSDEDNEIETDIDDVET
jgi:hypothetical protein